MKTKLLLSLLLSFYFCLLSSQIPQGFNYQAIARDGSGNPITGQPLQVKLAVMGDSIGTNIIWEELFSSVTTNAFGLFTVPLGRGTRQVTSNVPAFSSINWKLTPMFVRTQIYYQGVWKNMGSTRLWSVPYAMISGGIGGAQPYLNVTGNTTAMDSALFVVRNNTGQIVFAVYNEGVRVYVDDGISGKGAKGGFAIGSFNKSKGPSQNLMIVRPDTFRIFFDDTPGKTTKGGFAIGGFSTAKGAGLEYLGVKGSTPEIIVPSQARILWYPLKEAFLTGRVIVVSPDSIGLNSFASGFESKAKGGWSQALGYQAVAKGNYSTSIGKNSLAFGLSSYSFGDHSRAEGTGSYALGTYAYALGNQSIAIGSVGVDTLGHPTGRTIASGLGSFAAGFGSVASGQGAFTFGVNDTASGPYATAFGFATVAKDWFTTSMGVGSRAEGGSTTAMGFFTHTKGIASTATGWGTLVDSAGWGGMANGCSTVSKNWVAVAFGDRTTASGHTSFATGYKTIASGHLASTFGDNTVAAGDGAIAIGHFTNAQAYGSLVLGRYNLLAGTTNAWYSWEPVFVIGNGSSDVARSNAMTVYKSGVADFGSYLNLNRTSSGAAIYVSSKEALWSDATHFSWGYGLDYNYFVSPINIGGTDVAPSYALNVNGNINCTGGYYNNSDARWKTNLQPVDNIIPALNQLQPYRFNWRINEFPDMKFDNSPQLGLIAQDVEAVFPELVRTDNKGYKAVSYEKLSVLLLEGLKEQQKQIDTQKKENDILRSELDEMREEIRQIRSMAGENK